MVPSFLEAANRKSTGFHIYLVLPYHRTCGIGLLVKGGGVVANA